MPTKEILELKGLQSVPIVASLEPLGTMS